MQEDAGPFQNYLGLGRCSRIAQPTEEEDYDWASQWEDDVDSVVSSSLVDTFPPQLHPAVSLGLQRVSSCAYFSLQGSVSEADLHSMSSGGIVVDDREAHADWLYHDVIMHVFTFLDAKSLAAFSETARRCNYECFYFLQLQLQRALLDDNLKASTHVLPSSPASAESNNDRLAAIAGSWTISRLASMDKKEAQNVVQEYLDSNSTLRTMPFSHSLAYIRQVLRRNGFPGGQSSGQPSQALTTSAAVLIGLVGAATVMSGNVNVEVVESFGTELPNMIFKVGFVGSLMGAAKHGWEVQNKARKQTNQHETTTDNDQRASNQNEHSQFTMRETAEQIARSLQEMLQQIRITPLSSEGRSSPSSPQAQDGFFTRRMYDAFLAASGVSVDCEGDSKSDDHDIMRQQQQEELLAIHSPFSPNPYEHLPRHSQDDANGEEKMDEHESRWSLSMADRMLGFGMPLAAVMSSSHRNPSITTPSTKMPSGCVGAYFRAIQRASKSITQLVQKERQVRFESLSNKDDIARSFIDACCSDDTLDTVKNLVQVRSVIDASGFYVGSDGTETCALHASAFHGATEVLEFLCGGIDERDASKDQGLCSVDLQDVNGWTALHFAAGANCVESARILADRGANLSVVAENGYTPIQWAQRLSNHEVAEELRKRLDQADPYHTSNHRWITGASQPLSMIARRFFAIMESRG